jgi:hypothetical protein
VDFGDIKICVIRGQTNAVVEANMTTARRKAREAQGRTSSGLILPGTVN